MNNIYDAQKTINSIFTIHRTQIYYFNYCRHDLTIKNTSTRWNNYLEKKQNVPASGSERVGVSVVLCYYKFVDNIIFTENYIQ